MRRKLLVENMEVLVCLFVLYLKLYLWSTVHLGLANNNVLLTH